MKALRFFPPSRSVLLLVLGQGAAVLTIWMVATVWASFNPTMSADISDHEHDVNADITTTFSLPDGDLNYAKLVALTPTEFFPAGNVPLGVLVGQVNWYSTLALFGGSCTTGISPAYPLWEATTDTSACPIMFRDQFTDGDGDGLPDGIVCWPEFLTRILPPGATPIERFYGQTQVGASPASINIVTFEAGSLPGLSVAWGRPSVVIVNDMGDPERQVKPMEALTDTCTPMDLQIITYGLSKDNPDTPDVEPAHEVRRNPPYGGTYTFRWHAESERDADHDEVENPLDTCPLDVNIDPSPMDETQVGGDDGDGIDASCDPDPLVACWNPRPANCAVDYPYYATDCDCDGFRNRLDTCPLVPNGCNDIWCSGGGSWPYDPSWDEQQDSDGDYIGDACDPNPTIPDGEPVVVDLSTEVEISGPQQPQQPVGGIVKMWRDPTARSPQEPSGGTGPHILLAVGGAAAVLALSASAWYARRRWVRR